ncbi:MAG: helix-hairpin-helix domain-containing protein [Lachnospiraceae bacterium]|nr:helix-hairpin-helix domain-containing protein [Lachnospiraceae bacterium]
MIKKYNRIFLSILAIIVCILFGCERKETIYLTEQGIGETEEALQIPETSSSPVMPENERQETEVCMVHICGAVVHPGVYELTEGSRIYQAVEAAGGFTKEAAQDYLNQAQSVKDGERLYIPTLKEAEQAMETGMVPGGFDGSGTAEENGLVNINTADEDALCTLPGIGSGKAKSIIEYRTKNGEFHKIEDIMQVEGIKEGLFEKIKDSITV